jgi:malonyl-CoA/methylmalonyl-CoA synthetase
VGFPLPGVDLRITDDHGMPLGAGEVGDVEVRGDCLGLGYWGLPDATADATADATTDDGWFVTGDVGFLDDEGRLTLSGRATDLIISGGLNIYPREIEEVLDAVDGVAESAVIGVADPDFGERVVAVVVGSPEVEAALVATSEERLARFKHPRRYEFVDELPRNTMGKVQKTELRERFSSSGR